MLGQQRQECPRRLLLVGEEGHWCLSWWGLVLRWSLRVRACEKKASAALLVQESPHPLDPCQRVLLTGAVGTGRRVEQDSKSGAGCGVATHDSRRWMVAIE